MANSDPSPETRFKEGQSGNPNGRPPKGYSITETIRAMMDEKPKIKRKLAEKVLFIALKGDLAAIKLIWSYLDGMPIQSSNLTSDGKTLEGPVIYLPQKNDDR